MNDDRPDVTSETIKGVDTARLERGAPRRPRAGQTGRATRPRHPDRPCLNCGDATRGEYCPACGQRKVDIQVSVRALMADVLEDQFLVDRRLPRTLFTLLFKPGVLTVEHVNGRIASYARPFKLYLASSVIFFLLLSFISLRALDRAHFGDQTGGEAIAAAAGTATPNAEDTTDPQAERTDPADADTPSLEADPAAPADRSVQDRGTGSEWISSVQVNTGVAPVDSAVSARLRRLAQLETRQALHEVVRSFLSYGPTAMFVLLPVFAAVLKLLYIRRRRFYAEHFVFLLHTHSFLFAVFTILLLTRPWLGSGLTALPLLWAIVYVYIAMKRVYGQGWLKTFIKYWTLGWMYFWVLTISIPFLFIATILLLPS